MKDIEQKKSDAVHQELFDQADGAAQEKQPVQDLMQQPESGYQNLLEEQEPVVIKSLGEFASQDMENAYRKWFLLLGANIVCIDLSLAVLLHFLNMGGENYGVYYFFQILIGLLIMAAVVSNGIYYIKKKEQVYPEALKYLNTVAVSTMLLNLVNLCMSGKLTGKVDYFGILTTICLVGSLAVAVADICTISMKTIKKQKKTHHFFILLGCVNYLLSSTLFIGLVKMVRYFLDDTWRRYSKLG